MLWSVYLDRESEAVNPDKESDERYDDVGVSRPSFHSPTVASAEGDERRWVGFGLSLSFDPSPHRNRP